MSKVQSEKIQKYPVEQKKLLRLLNKNDLSNQDSLFLNYVYEEKNSLNFFYGIAFNGISAVTLNYIFFRDSHKLRQFGFCAGYFLVVHSIVRNLTNRRFDRLIVPYFQKYQVK